MRLELNQAKRSDLSSLRRFQRWLLMRLAELTLE
jgi:hypothetical protein